MMMPYQEHQEPPKITPRAYTIQEMEDMREAIKSIMIGEDYSDDEDTYYADDASDKIEIEERLRTHMLCNQPPEPLIAEGQRLEEWRWAKYKEAEARREEKRKELAAAGKARFDRECQLEIERQMRAFQRVDEPEPEKPIEDDFPVPLITAISFAIVIFGLLVMFS